MLKHVCAALVFVAGLMLRHPGLYGAVLMVYGLWLTDKIGET